MSSKVTHIAICPVCGQEFTVESYVAVNVAENPDLKERIINGELFIETCPKCGDRRLSAGTFVYSDPASNLILVCSPQEISAEVPEGSTFRQVSRIGDLIEKIKIFDNGLDDIAIEMCKFVTAQELGKEVDLKFLRLDGADNEIILTYPEKGQMEMLSIGFNVYEDCCGILKRNPSASEAFLRRH